MIGELSELGASILSFFSEFYRVLNTPVLQLLRGFTSGQPTIPGWLIEIIKSVRDLLANFIQADTTLLGFMFGTGVAFFVAVTLVNWLLKIIRG